MMVVTKKFEQKSNDGCDGLWFWSVMVQTRDDTVELYLCGKVHTLDDAVSSAENAMHALVAAAKKANSSLDWSQVAQ